MRPLARLYEQPYDLDMNNAAKTEATETQTSKLVEGKWDRHGDQFVASIRCGGRGGEYVGRQARLRSKAKDYTFITLGRVVEDFGAGDVVLFEVIR
jgi:hypothetical protein